VIGWFVATRIFILCAAHLGAASMSGHARARWSGISLSWLARPSKGELGPSPAQLLEPLVRWDSLYYLYIAREGYPPREPPAPKYEVAFFPLYPLLVRAVDRGFCDIFWSAVIVSNLSAFLAGLVFLRYATAISSPSAGRRSTLLLLASPGAHFLSLPYTEGLFVLLMVCGLLALERERPLTTGILAALATATRSAGIALTLLLVVSAWNRRADPRAFARRMIAAVGSLGGMGAFSLYCWRRYGDALAFVHIQHRWGRRMSLAGPWRAFFGFNVDPDYYLVTIGALALAVWMIRNMRARESLAAWLLLLLPLATGSLKSMIRFQSANPPLVAAAGTLPTAQFRGLLIFSTLMMLLEVFLFSAGFPHY